MDNPVTFISNHFGNHASVSGYERVAAYLPGTVVERVQSRTFGQRVAHRILRPLYKRSGSQWYGRDGLLTECSLVLPWLRRSGQIFHFLYGENGFRHLGHLKALRNNYIVATYHTPPKRFFEVVRKRDHLQSIDAAIIVSSALQSVLSDLIGESRVFRVPHGIDTTYFQPPTSPRKAGEQFRCLFVGSHLRDFETLAAVARSFLRTHPDIRFEVLVLPNDAHHFAGIENIHLLPRLNDDELLALYQQADLFVFPLKDATANNSLLEAMACGMPIITTDLPGVRDYTDDSSAVLCPGGCVDAVRSAILRLRDDAASRERLGQAARAAALAFSYERTAQLTMSVYREILERAPVRWER